MQLESQSPVKEATKKLQDALESFPEKNEASADAFARMAHNAFTRCARQPMIQLRALLANGASSDHDQYKIDEFLDAVRIYEHVKSRLTNEEQELILRS